MTTPDNITAFRVCAGVILTRLYAAFPVPQDLDILYLQATKDPAKTLANYDDVMKAMNQGDATTEDGLNAAINLYRHTIRYLLAEQLISATPSTDTGDERYFYGAVLRSKGLAAMGRRDLDQQFVFGDELISAVRDGKYQAVAGVVGKMLGLLVS